MWSAEAKQLPQGPWAIVFIDTEGSWQSIRYGWKELGSRLPMGEKQFKRQAQAMGGSLEKTMGEQKYGLAGTLLVNISSMAFPTKELAETAIAELITPSFLAVNLCRSR